MDKAILHEKRFVGKYVALRSAADKTVIAYGDDPSTVRILSCKKGVKEPLIFFVSEPENDVTRSY